MVVVILLQLQCSNRKLGHYFNITLPVSDRTRLILHFVQSQQNRAKAIKQKQLGQGHSLVEQTFEIIRALIHTPLASCNICRVSIKHMRIVSPIETSLHSGLIIVQTCGDTGPLKYFRTCKLNRKTFCCCAIILNNVQK